MQTDALPRRSVFDRFLDLVERAGNRLPDPSFIFIGLCALILVASAIASTLGWSAINPATGKTVEAVNLLSAPNLIRILEDSIKNFSAFPPLGMVLAIMIGVGIAEKSGYFDTLMKSALMRTPRNLVIPMVILVGILGNITSDGAIVVLPPIAAMVFLRMGYHPLAGLLCAYAAALGGFSANLMVGVTDVLALAFTEPAAALIDPDVPMNAAMNYYFIAVSTFLLLGVAWWVTCRIVIPRLGPWQPEGQVGRTVSAGDASVSPQERKAMWAANVSVILMLIGLAWLTVPEGAPLRNPVNGSLIDKSPLMNGIILIITLLFLVPGLVYALVSGTARSTRDIGTMMNEAMAGMGSYIVIVFFAAQMLAYFNWSNLGTIIAIKGAATLAGQNGITLVVGIVMLSAIINLLIGSSSAKWAILAPVFVPMMMLLGFHPAFTQIAYRVGDSITNPITPVMPYLPLILAYAQRYVKHVGLGTLTASLLPYTIAFGIFWTLLLVVWYLAGWPVGPGGPIHLQPAG